MGNLETKHTLRSTSSRAPMWSSIVFSMHRRCMNNGHNGHNELASPSIADRPAHSWQKQRILNIAHWLTISEPQNCLLPSRDTRNCDRVGLTSCCVYVKQLCNLSEDAQWFWLLLWMLETRSLINFLYVGSGPQVSIWTKLALFVSPIVCLRKSSCFEKYSRMSWRIPCIL